VLPQRELLPVNDTLGAVIGSKLNLFSASLRLPKVKRARAGTFRRKRHSLQWFGCVTKTTKSRFVGMNTITHTPKDDEVNAGLILTGRGSSSYKAFKQAFYKHAVLFSEQWPRGIDERGTPEIDD